MRSRAAAAAAVSWAPEAQVSGRHPAVDKASGRRWPLPNPLSAQF